MSAMYPNTMTVWNRLGETGRAETWRRTAVTEARVFEPSAFGRTQGGDDGRAAPSAILAPAGWVDPSAFDGSAGWTLRPRDMAAAGDVPGGAPPASAWTVSAAEAIRVGSSVHHVEAVF